MFLPQDSAAFLAVVLSIKKNGGSSPVCSVEYSEQEMLLESPCGLPRFHSMTELALAGQSLAGFQVFVVL